MKILGNRILVDVTKCVIEKTPAGLHIPEQFRARPCEAVVTIVGDGDPERPGFHLMKDINVGDRVRIDPNMGSQQIGEQQNVRIMSILDVLAVVEGTEDAAEEPANAERQPGQLVS